MNELQSGGGKLTRTDPSLRFLFLISKRRRSTIHNIARGYGRSLLTCVRINTDGFSNVTIDSNRFGSYTVGIN